MPNLIEKTKELVAVSRSLNRDEMVCQVEGRLNGDEAQFWRRMLVRAFFAQVEGTTHRMRLLAEEAANQFLPTGFDNRTVAKLRGVKYESGADAVTDESVRMTWDDSFKLAFRYFMEAYGATWTENLNTSDGWRALRDSNEVRDRITHPKQSSDLTVTQPELDRLVEASAWYSGQFETAKAAAMSRMGIVP